MKSATQPITGYNSLPRNAFSRVLLALAGLALIVAVVISTQFATRISSGSTGTAVEPAVNNALIEVRKNEREERYQPTVEQIRRALIEVRAGERGPLPN
jgi:hypothetical protein